MLCDDLFRNRVGFLAVLCDDLFRNRVGFFAVFCRGDIIAIERDILRERIKDKRGRIGGGRDGGLGFFSHGGLDLFLIQDLGGPVMKGANGCALRVIPGYRSHIRRCLSECGFVIRDPVALSPERTYRIFGVEGVELGHFLERGFFEHGVVARDLGELFFDFGFFCLDLASGRVQAGIGDLFFFVLRWLRVFVACGSRRFCVVVACGSRWLGVVGAKGRRRLCVVVACGCRRLGVRVCHVRREAFVNFIGGERFRERLGKCGRVEVVEHQVVDIVEHFRCREQVFVVRFGMDERARLLVFNGCAFGIDDLFDRGKLPRADLRFSLDGCKMVGTREDGGAWRVGHDVLIDRGYAECRRKRCRHIVFCFRVDKRKIVDTAALSKEIVVRVCEISAWLFGA